MYYIPRDAADCKQRGLPRTEKAVEGYRRAWQVQYDRHKAAGDALKMCRAADTLTYWQHYIETAHARGWWK